MNGGPDDGRKDDKFQSRLREAFAVEAREHLQSMAARLLELEKAAVLDQQREILESILREAHSLKGAAHAMGRTDVGSVCQALETVFSDWKLRGAEGVAESIDTLESALDFVEALLEKPNVSAELSDVVALHEMTRRVAHLIAPVAEPANPAPEHAAAPAMPAAKGERESAVSAVEAAPHEPERVNVSETVRVSMAKVDALLLQAEEMVGMKMAAGQHLGEVHALQEMLEKWRKESGGAGKASRNSASGAFPEEKIQEFFTWNDRRMEVFDKKLAEIVKGAERHHRTVGSMIDELLDGAKGLAMQPFARLLELAPRQVRDLAREQGKEVDLVLRGQGLEIDKRILEEMKTPLIHLVRNAIDHGLEKPDVRRRLGKPAKGVLTIAVSQAEGHKLEIAVSDDGAGIDLEKVKASALENRVVAGNELSQMSEAAALALILQSGVTTSPILTEVSGRGVGMAIVREKIEKLGGQISIETRVDAGTTFRIVLPATLATFKGILVCAGGQNFILPTTSVERITRVKRDEIKTVENRETISINERPLSLAWLADVLGLPRVEPKEATPFAEVLVLAVSEQRIAFAVEEVLNEQEVLVKKLKRPLKRVRNIAGAAVLASGSPVLILNAVDLLQSAIRLSVEGRAGRRVGGAGPPVVRQFRLLVADDSVTSRMLLKNILQSSGYHVTTAVDGVEAFTTLRTGEFDLVISDVEMPRMDGFELTAKIRADKHFAEVPVVLVTALGSREHQERGIDVGANAYIVKSSFERSNLLEVIRRLI